MHVFCGNEARRGEPPRTAGRIRVEKPSSAVLCCAALGWTGPDTAAPSVVHHFNEFALSSDVTKE